ncbi:MAG: UDP-N-acetylmuramoyl-L-alanyl-D-glutamate--2,6-diaminopimelate ligase [Kiritimatiellae bacterium]|nr:UDP-N-acetylmuramoyl-L-alanyl-D-glutamate--2,6-diaminopimelate ligase [Kiritimatiellia bacterium]
MKLSHLIPSPTLPDADIAGLAFDSRCVTPGVLFFAVDGNRDKGSKYVGDALARGAAAIVSQSPRPADGLPADAVWIQVPDVREALSRAACAFYGQPSHALAAYAVTGTNGKTTVAGLVRDILEAAGTPCGLLSTVEIAYPGHVEEASRTTPDPLTLQRDLAAMRDAGCGAVSMEASSHALVQSRTGGVRFAAAGFTNLSQDHFDYHAGFEDYFAAKSLLFRQLGAENPGAPGVVNADDPYGRRLLSMLPAMNVRPVSYAIGEDADVVARDVRVDVDRTIFRLCAGGHEAEIVSHLLGRYNVSNMLCAAGMALATGVPFETVRDTLSAAAPRWGRLEKTAEYNGAAIFVDYAHTPDAIGKVLGALREITVGRLIIVFGCGGDRDRAKRPQMAAIAAEMADFTILTSDNPRTEDPNAILDDAERGFDGRKADYIRITDREKAIQAAIGRARPGDTIVIAGKGHENYQEINGVKHPFDDREVVRRLCR